MKSKNVPQTEMDPKNMVRIRSLKSRFCCYSPMKNMCIGI